MVRLVRSSRIRPWSFAVAMLDEDSAGGFGVVGASDDVQVPLVYIGSFSPPKKLQPESVNKCQDRKTCMDSQLEGVRLISDMGATPFSWVEFICLRPVHL